VPVKKGDLLLNIDATSAGANLSETEVKLISQRARAARPEAEATGADALTFAPDMAATRAAADERLLFTSRRLKLDQELRVFDEMQRQRQAELSEVEGRRQRLAKEMATADQRSALVAGMAARNAASRLEVLEAQSRGERLATELNDAEAAVPKIRAGMAEARARADEVRARFRSMAQEDLVIARAEIERLAQILTAQADRVSRTEVRAPADGIINRVTANTVGGVIKPGEIIVELTPMAGEVLIEARARPADRGDLHPGLAVKVRVSAHDSGALGTLSGEVREVSADTVQDSRGDAHYPVGIRVDDLPPAYSGRLLAPGMTVTADIVTGRRTVLRHMVSPLAKFTDNAFRDPR
jgi:membrane fusion protein, adhesin transport system